MKVLITGAAGQLGGALKRTAPPAWEILAPPRAVLDLASDSVATRVQTLKPDVVINAAAYTNVDGAEDEPDAAFAVNADGAGRLAQAAAACKARFIQVSTDYVFDGRAARPYRPEDEMSPLGVYGRSKAEGERRVHAGTEGRALVVRTAWLYASTGRNFPLTLLERMAKGEPLRVVDDQLGTPTWADDLAAALWKLAGAADLSGTLHWTHAGIASWYDFAVAIQEEALALGLLGRAVSIVPVRTADYPRRAQRPACSVLDKSACWQALGAPADHWRAGLRRMLAQRVAA